ncbi:hypothetical protein ABTY00_26785 [Streptomyces microflavus]|uniref:hypothetical protein n=1 Tax=Streptomyces microflavus TaxID=1919 RepID=UPI00332BC064
MEDTARQRRGTLRAIAPDVDKPVLVAWLLPVGEGVEWTTAPGALAHPERFTTNSPPRS